MADASGYCAELVRTADRDRYLAALFAPAEQRGALHALYAFNSEVARVRDLAREPLPGEIRLQWWSDVLRGERGGEAAANPIGAALLASIESCRLPRDKLTELVEARRFDLYDEPMTTLEQLETYADKTSSAIFSLTSRILCGVDAEAAAEPAGRAYTIAGLMRTFPLHAARRQLYVPLELIERHAVKMADIFAGRSSSGLNAALAELRNVARRHLATTRKRLPTLPREALPAFLPLALVGPTLDRMERSDAFAPAELAPWRRQWLLWRAARNPARLLGGVRQG
jgi:15-cis-phytoene synthase